MSILRRQPRIGNERIYTNIQATTSGSDAVVATPRHPEEWCDFVTDDAIPF